MWKPTTWLLLAALLALPSSWALAQSPNGITAGKPTIGLSYYKVPPGRQDDWLRLFMKWHYPLIQEMIREGAITDFKLFLPNTHARNAGWDFVGMTIGATTPPKVKGRVSMHDAHTVHHVSAGPANKVRATGRPAAPGDSPPSRPIRARGTRCRSAAALPRSTQHSRR